MSLAFWGLGGLESSPHGLVRTVLQLGFFKGSYNYTALVKVPTRVPSSLGFRTLNPGLLRLPPDPQRPWGTGTVDPPWSKGGACFESFTVWGFWL